MALSKKFRSLITGEAVSVPELPGSFQIIVPVARQGHPGNVENCDTARAARASGKDANQVSLDVDAALIGAVKSHAEVTGMEFAIIPVGGASASPEAIGHGGTGLDM